jgi:hypothetical protein
MGMAAAVPEGSAFWLDDYILIIRLKYLVRLE